MDRDDFFDNLRNEQNELRGVQYQLAYEERTIKRAFAECGIKITGWGRMANMCRHETGQDRLNFAWFNQAFRSFPGRLCGRRIPRMHELTMKDLFKPFDRNRLVRAVAKALAREEVDGEDNKYVFVFPAVRTFFCAHNLGYEVPGVSLSIRQDDKLLVSICQTKSLFQAIGNEWFEL